MDFLGIEGRDQAREIIHGGMDGLISLIKKTHMTSMKMDMYTAYYESKVAEVGARIV